MCYHWKLVRNLYNVSLFSSSGAKDLILFEILCSQDTRVWHIYLADPTILQIKLLAREPYFGTHLGFSQLALHANSLKKNKFEKQSLYAEPHPL